MDAREASKARIRELEDNIKTLAQRAVEKETELERFDMVFSFVLLLLLCGSCE